MTFCYHWVWKGQNHLAYLSVSFTSKQNFFEEKLNSQKLIWFYFFEKTFLSTIICVPNFVASNYRKVITDIFFFVLYWFTSFLKFGPLPSENPKCAPACPGKIEKRVFCKRDDHYSDQCRTFILKVGTSSNGR